MKGRYLNLTCLYPTGSAEGVAKGRLASPRSISLSLAQGDGAFGCTEPLVALAGMKTRAVLIHDFINHYVADAEAGGTLHEVIENPLPIQSWMVSAFDGFVQMMGCEMQVFYKTGLAYGFGRYFLGTAEDIQGNTKYYLFHQVPPLWEAVELTYDEFKFLIFDTPSSMETLCKVNRRLDDLLQKEGVLK